MREQLTIRQTLGFICTDNKTFATEEEAANHQRAIVLAEHIMTVVCSADSNRFEAFHRDDAMFLAERLMSAGYVEAVMCQKVEVLK
jgi:hypothetical protein